MSSPIPRHWLVALSPYTEVFLGIAFVEPFLEVRQDTERVLVVASRYGELMFDRRKRTVSRGGEVLASFGDIRSVDISSRARREDQRTWSVTLYLSFFHRIGVGRIADDADASLAAARIAATLGCKVVSLVPRI